MSIPVKICGLMRTCDIHLCHRLNVQIAGFVTEYPVSVPWNLTVSQTKALIQEVASPMKSCIVTGGNCNQILSNAEFLRPDYVQLHFHETLEDTAFITNSLKALSIGVIKTLPVDTNERIRQFGTASPATCVAALERIQVKAILIDSRTPDNACDSGALPDLTFYHTVSSMTKLPVILAGGITPSNINQVIEEVSPDCIDVMTGIEESPGVKNKKLLTNLMYCAQSI